MSETPRPASPGSPASAPTSPDPTSERVITITVRQGDGLLMRPKLIHREAGERVRFELRVGGNLEVTPYGRCTFPLTSEEPPQITVARDLIELIASELLLLPEALAGWPATEEARDFDVVGEVDGCLVFREACR